MHEDEVLFESEEDEVEVEAGTHKRRHLQSDGEGDASSNKGIHDELPNPDSATAINKSTEMYASFAILFSDIHIKGCAAHVT